MKINKKLKNNKKFWIAVLVCKTKCKCGRGRDYKIIKEYSDKFTLEFINKMIKESDN